MKMLKFFIMFCICSALAACVKHVAKQTVEPKQAVEAKPVEPKQTGSVKLAPSKNSDASEFLTFAEAYSDLSADAQKQELKAANQILARNPNDLLHRMKLVMIYGLPSSSVQDSQKAQNLLQQILQENILIGSQQAFAHVMFDYIVAFNKFNKSTHQDDKLVEQLQSKLEAAQQKLDAAQQKVNELKNIEKSMGERENSPNNQVVPKK